MTTDIIDEPLDDTPEGGAELTADAAPIDDGSTGAGTGAPDDDGPPRDKAGRFAPKAEADTAQTTDTPAADPNAAPVTGEPAPNAPVADAAPAGTPAAPTGPDATPWAVKALGESFSVPGSRVNADGTVALTPEGAELVHRYIGKGIKLEREFPRLRAELEQARQQRTELDEQNAIVAQEFARMATLTDENLVQAVREFRANYPALKAEARAQFAERRLAERERAAQPDPEQERAQLAHQVRASLDEGFDTVKSQPWAKGLTAEDLAELRAAVDQVGAASFLTTAPNDDPDNGVRKGELLFDEARFLAFVQRTATPITRARSASQQAAAAAQRNAATMQPAVTAPPSVGGNRTAAPAASKPKAAASPAPSAAEQRLAWRKEMGLDL